jgi:hypothetical protein
VQPPLDFYELKTKYLACMLEIKERTDVCAHLIEDGHTFLSENLQCEFVALQLRRVLELIAISSFVANKRLFEKQEKKIGAHVNFRSTINGLEKLYPSFFPKPYVLGKGQSGERSHHASSLPNGIIPLQKKNFGKRSQALQQFAPR